MCNCVNVELGTYSNQVALKIPSNITIRRNNPEQEIRTDVNIDKCISEEIKYLWSQGVRTTGCCCGHNIVPSYIGVIDEDISKMKNLGYEVRFNPCRPNDDDSFVPKSI